MVSQEWVRDSRRCLVCIYVNLHRQKVSGEIVEIVAGARLQKLLEFEGGDDPERLHTPGLEEVERVLRAPQVSRERPAVHQCPITHMCCVVIDVRQDLAICIWLR